MSTTLAPRTHSWTRGEYYKIADAGLFHSKRVELIEGQVVEMSPVGSVHATGVVLVARVLEDVLKDGYVIRWQMPLALSEHSEPEPDVAVVQGSVRDYTRQHLAIAVLVVEVFDTSLGYDRTTKAALYAEAGIAEYWIINLRDSQIEAHRQPQPTAEGYGYRYAETVALSNMESITPRAAPAVSISIEDLLP